jgi:uncharacterized protein (TIGR02246 family)
MSAEIRKVIDALAEAVRKKDVEAMLAHCADDIVVFDMVAPLAHEGTDAIRRIWETTLAGFVPPIEYEIHKLEIESGGDIAFARSLNRFGGTSKDGTRTVNWVRATLGLRKSAGVWKLAHQHVSVPFEMESGKALLELEP